MPKPQLEQRLKREAEDIMNNFKDQLRLEIVDDQKHIWHITFEGAPGSVYAGETYKLHFRFTEEYPFDSPEVMFVGTPPEHLHVYSCGFICLSTLGSDWTPALKTSSVCMSILSMLSSATQKMSPPNDASASAYM